MPKVEPLRKDLLLYLKRHNLLKKYFKQAQIFELNHLHPSLNTEILEPKNYKLYSFRIDRKYRAILIKIAKDKIEVVDINLHYK